MAKENKFWPTEVFTKAKGNMTKEKAEGKWFGRMETFLKENGKWPEILTNKDDLGER